MSSKFALVTPSFAPDFERCQLLVETADRYAAANVDHIIIVDRRDAPLFSQLRGRRTHLVLKETILPRKIVQVPLSPRWWIDFGNLHPIRGWIIQQLTKLSVPKLGDYDGFVFVDSDTFFVKPYDPEHGARDGLMPMFREVMPRADYAPNVAWHQTAERLFGLPPDPAQYRINYVSQLVTWRRENVLKMWDHIERTTGKPWVEVISKLSTVSEYALYGVFCERVLGDASRHYWQHDIETLCSWGVASLGVNELRAIRDKVDHQVAVMVSAKSNTPVSRIRSVFDLG